MKTKKKSFTSSTTVCLPFFNRFSTMKKRRWQDMALRSVFTLCLLQSTLWTHGKMDRFFLLTFMTPIFECDTNVRGSPVNRALDDSTYPGSKLAPSSFCKTILLVVWNETTYTWDWLCHLVDDGALFVCNECYEIYDTTTILIKTLLKMKVLITLSTGDITYNYINNNWLNLQLILLYM